MQTKFFRSSTFHKWATITWATVGGVVTWHYPNAVWWVAIMSLWANVIGHWDGYQSARAEERIEGKQ